MILASNEKRARYRASGHWGERTIYGLFLSAHDANPQGEALVDPINRAAIDGAEPRRLTWAQAKAEIEAVSAGLAALGLKKDDRILLQGPNFVELGIMMMVAARMGFIISPMAVQYEAMDVAKNAETLGAALFVGVSGLKGQGMAARAAPVLAGTATKVADYADLLKTGTTVEAPAVDADDCYTVCWTSGTTGSSKGVPRSHNHWIAQGVSAMRGLGIEPGDRILCPFPFVNMAAIGGSLLPWLVSRGTLVLHHPFDIPMFLKQIAVERINNTLAPPAVLTMLLKEQEKPDGVRPDFSSLRFMSSGSAPLPPAMVKGWQERGLLITNVFGSNEGASMNAKADVVPDPELRATHFPLVNPDSPMEAKIVNAEGATITQPGIPGELMIRGPNIFEGYWQMGAGETAHHHLFDHEGYFRTGDLFAISEADSTLVRYVGRIKDIIIRGGFNISIEEVESLITGDPRLLEAAAFSVPDPVLGERIGLAIVKSGEVAPTREEFATELKARGVSPMKWPEVIFELDRLPRNAMNKVMRADIQRLWQEKEQERHG